jgi:hypothetical protein
MMPAKRSMATMSIIVSGGAQGRVKFSPYPNPPTCRLKSQPSPRRANITRKNVGISCGKISTRKASLGSGIVAYTNSGYPQGYTYVTNTDASYWGFPVSKKIPTPL